MCYNDPILSKGAPIMERKIKFGVFADLHTQLMPDTTARLTAFLDECRKEDVDFIIQLGDFTFPDSPLCTPEDPEEYRKIVELFNGFEKPAYHVIGNHDCDTCSKEEILRFWGCDHKPFYSFDMGGFHFVVLDCNFLKIDGKYISYDHANYFTLNRGPEPRLPYISDEQLAWLEQDLAATGYPSVLFSHQRLCRDPDAILNHEALRRVIDAAPNKVLLSINGHEHIDNAEKVGSTWYYNLNSASMYWLGEDFAAKGRYGEEVDRRYPWLCCTAPYERPLYAIITMDEKGAAVKGKETAFVGPPPEAVGAYAPGTPFSTKLRSKITAGIEDRYMSFE